LDKSQGYGGFEGPHDWDGMKTARKGQGATIR
jgi:hypothetical protein